MGINGCTPSEVEILARSRSCQSLLRCAGLSNPRRVDQAKLNRIVDIRMGVNRWQDDRVPFREHLSSSRLLCHERRGRVGIDANSVLLAGLKARSQRDVGLHYGKIGGTDDELVGDLVVGNDHLDLIRFSSPDFVAVELGAATALGETGDDEKLVLGWKAFEYSDLRALNRRLSYEGVTEAGLRQAERGRCRVVYDTR